jgi:hypothetical protein
MMTVPTNQMGQIHMALNIPNQMSATQGEANTVVSDHPVTLSSSFLSLTQNCTPLHLQCLVPASSSTLSASHLSPYIELSSSQNVNGTILPYTTTISTRFNPLQLNDRNGHVNALLKLPFSKNSTTFEMMLGAWMTNDSIHHLFVPQDQNHYFSYQNSSNNNNKLEYIDDVTSWNQPPLMRIASTRNYSPSTIHLQGVMEYHQSIVALHAELPLSVNSGYIPEHFDTLLWINLGGGGDAGKNSHHNHSSSSLSSPSSPPLWLTLKQSSTRGQSSPHNYTLNLSQTMSFDRKCWNILEDRAPLIRNHVGWTFQIQQQQPQPYLSEQEDQSSVATWSFAACWQVNSHVAIKAVLDHNGNYLRTNIMFKNWQPPRMTLSILHGFDLVNGGKWKWLGCGWEIESAATTTVATRDRTQKKNDSSDHKSSSSSSSISSIIYPTLGSVAWHETTNLEVIKTPLPTKIQVTVPLPSSSCKQEE